MKVQNTNSPNFGSVPIYRAKLKQPLLLRPFLKAKEIFISELEPSDIQRLSKQYDYWEDTSYGGRIIGDFIQTIEEPMPLYDKNKRFFVAETIAENAEKRKIEGLTLAEVKKDFVYLSFLQSQREKHKLFSQNGVGSCLLFLLSRMANLMKKEYLELQSTDKAINFYKKQKYFDLYIERRNECTINYLQLLDEAMDEFEKKISQKYSITPMIDEKKYFC